MSEIFPKFKPNFHCFSSCFVIVTPLSPLSPQVPSEVGTPSMSSSLVLIVFYSFKAAHCPFCVYFAIGPWTHLPGPTFLTVSVDESCALPVRSLSLPPLAKACVALHRQCLSPRSSARPSVFGDKDQTHSLIAFDPPGLLSSGTKSFRRSGAFKVGGHSNCVAVLSRCHLDLSHHSLFFWSLTTSPPLSRTSPGSL